MNNIFEVINELKEMDVSSCEKEVNFVEERILDLERKVVKDGEVLC